MLNCDDCMADIGTKAEPIFIDSNDSLVCRRCYTEFEGHPPDELYAEYDPDEVTQEEVDRLRVKKSSRVLPWLINGQQDLVSLLKEFEDLLLHKVAFSVTYEEPNLVKLVEYRED